MSNENKRNFMDRLRARWSLGSTGLFVCVGLDPDYGKLPECVKKGDDLNAIVTFVRAIVEATHDRVCAFKLNSAFFEARGARGFSALKMSIAAIHAITKGEVPVILDAKRADIGNTNNGYVQAAFDELKADAITVHPFLGAEALEPFLAREEKGIFVLCRTSNPGAGEFQSLRVEISEEEQRTLRSLGGPDWSTHADGYFHSTSLSNHIAYRVSRNWNSRGNCGVVAGATAPNELSSIRKIVGDMPILIPGIGKQGGDLAKSVAAGMDSQGKGMIINSSSGVIFASSGKDFAEAARAETIKLDEQISAEIRRIKKLRDETSGENPNQKESEAA